MCPRCCAYRRARTYSLPRFVPVRPRNITISRPAAEERGAGRCAARTTFLATPVKRGVRRPPGTHLCATPLRHDGSLGSVETIPEGRPHARPQTGSIPANRGALMLDPPIQSRRFGRSQARAVNPRSVKFSRKLVSRFDNYGFSPRRALVRVELMVVENIYNRHGYEAGGTRVLHDPSPCLFEQIGQNLASVPFKKSRRKKQCKKRASVPL